VNTRFPAQDHCFIVHANIGNTPVPVDAAKPICAHLKPVQAWTLK
jgi:hypothetical protein